MPALREKLANTNRPVIWPDFDACAESLLCSWTWLDQAANDGDNAEPESTPCQ